MNERWDKELTNIVKQLVRDRSLANYVVLIPQSIGEHSDESIIGTFERGEFTVLVADGEPHVFFRAVDFNFRGESRYALRFRNTTLIDFNYVTTSKISSPL